MAYHDNLKDALAEVLKLTKEAMEEDIMPKAKEIHVDEIDRAVYQTYNPSNPYTRTEELKKSVDVKSVKINGTSVVGETFHDPSKANHYSIVSEGHVDINDLVDWIENGKVYPLWGNDESYTYLQPRPFIESAQNKTDKQFDKILKKALRKKGLKVE